MDTTGRMDAAMPVGATKDWFRSKTVWGALVALLAGVSALFGVEFDRFEQEEMATALFGAASAFGALLAIAGRMRARTRLR